MLLRAAVDRQPQRQPDKSDSAQQEKSRTPSPMYGNPGNNQRRSDGAKIAPSIENSGSQRALLHRKPLRNGLEAGRKNCRLAKTQGNASREKAGERTCHAVSE